MNNINTLCYITSQEFMKKIEDSLVKKAPLLSIATFSTAEEAPQGKLCKVKVVVKCFMGTL